MRLRTIVLALLIIQTVLVGHLVWRLQGDATGLVAVNATPGGITELTIYPTTSWGGVTGMLTAEGSTSVTPASGSVMRRDIYFLNPANNCSKTELVASVSGSPPSQVQEIDPYQADQLLGMESRSPFSNVAMFDERHTFDLEGRQVTLWGTRTRGKLGDFLQGVGTAGGSVVYVTQTKRNAQSYNGEAANYQFILPPGNWQVTADMTDTCTPLDEFITADAQSAPPRLQASLPERVCVDRDNELYAVHVSERVQCRPHEIGRQFCAPAGQVAASVLRDGVSVLSHTTDGTGAIPLTPTETGTYRLELRGANETVMTTFTVGVCLAHGFVTVEDRVIELPGIDLPSPGETTTVWPRPESPFPLASAQAEYLLITLVTFLLVGLGSVAYYGAHKDDSITILKARVWMLERLRR